MAIAQRKAPWWRRHHISSANRVVIALYSDALSLMNATRQLTTRGCPPDLISALGRIHLAGADSLGIYSLKLGGSMRAWGERGVYWSALWGILEGPCGLFFLPGIGPIAAAGYLAESITGGSAVDAGMLTGLADMTHLEIGLRRAGIPDPESQRLRVLIRQGNCLLMLRGARPDLAKWRQMLEACGPLEIGECPRAFPLHAAGDLPVTTA